MIFAPATEAHVDDLAPRLRAADRAEIAALAGIPPHTALAMSWRTSTEALTFLLDDRPEAIFGVRAGVLGRAALVWALGSDALSANPLRLIRGVRTYIDKWSEEYGMLANTVHEDNHASITLLRHLGFTFGPNRNGAINFWRA